MRLIAAALACLIPLTATAQDAPSTILVMDASGSMWGQIDGVNKIVIARDVVADILADFPADQNLGLTVYGHRTEGDCTDIETVIAPAPGTAQAIIDAVNSINPNGKTPMTDAVIAAANALSYTGQPATVILVSDGIETCNPDPCAAARALEEAGVGFTAHVVGFDVGAEPEALAQMQCIAAETGGQFLTAANADELNLAMATVMAAVADAQPAPAPEPDPGPTPEPAIIIGPVQLSAIVRSAAGTPLADVASWTVTGPDGTVAEGLTGNPVDIDLAVGTYTATATDLTGATASVDFSVLNDQPMAVAVEFAQATPDATLTAPDQAPAGGTLLVDWTGPNDSFDNIAIALPGAENGSLFWAYTDQGTPAALQLPAAPGAYELRYRWEDAVTIATRAITLVESPVVLVAPASVPGGATIPVEWKGPNATYDNIQIGSVGGTDYSDYRYTSDGNPVQLVMPWEPGNYEIRYQFRDAETILTRPITITAGDVSLTAPDTAPQGTVIDIGWTGPNATFDNIQIGSVGGGDYSAYAYVTDGNPVRLAMPAEPGAYELRYQFRDREVIYRQPITVAAMTIAVSGPASAGAGSTISVDWQGPDGPSDFIGIGSAADSSYLTYAYTASGNPAVVQVPGTPGDYAIRYFSGTTAEILASAPLTVTPVTATVSFKGTALAGQLLAVDWSGPGNPTDFIAVGEVGGTYLNYSYAPSGNPAMIQLPQAAGTYELRYYLGIDSSVLATITVEVRAK